MESRTVSVLPTTTMPVGPTITAAVPVPSGLPTAAVPLPAKVTTAPATLPLRTTRRMRALL